MEKPYERSTHTTHVVAIRKGQRKVYAPEHDTWGEFICDECNEGFGVGPSRIYGARGIQQSYLDRLKTLLAKDHKEGVEHRDEYDLGW